ncbi:hypothetical protein [Vibrio nigripulchritudo]|uniref:hypothetical protein n=1 Tax=Vibrio nigripulchritudo TaxID=28173 RepID=UPI0003B19981|nr:hypothetical protein [Vibrio nigripulchritudo]CCN69792.1 hypothetical protein VIBNISFn118_150046 [Vibrio nigripulchritudo SFn118]
MNLFNEEMTQALAKPHVSVMYAVRLEWPGEVIRLHSEVGKFTHFPFDDGEIYHGSGALGSIGDIAFGDGDETSPSVTLELSVIDDAIRAQILAGGYQNKRGQLYMLVTNKAGDVLAWAELFDGVMDSGTVLQGRTNKVSLPLVCLDDGMNKGKSDRCTNESHKAQYAGDAFYKYTYAMEDFAIYFGNKKDGIPLRHA